MLPTVLVADDDRLLRESLCDMLGEFGCRAKAVASASGAIQLLSAEDIDLVLSDVDMPDATGFVLLSWIEEHRRVPAALMSARADQVLAEAARRAGALALIPKPVEVRILGGLIHRLFDRHP